MLKENCARSSLSRGGPDQQAFDHFLLDENQLDERPVWSSNLIDAEKHKTRLASNQHVLVQTIIHRSVH